MITGFEVGAVFKLIDEITGPLRKIMESIRELNAEIKIARESLAGFSGAVAGGLAGTITEVNELTAAWERVTAATRTAAASARGGATAATGGFGGFRPRSAAAMTAAGGGGSYGPGMAHITGPGIPLPGGSHARLGGTPGMVGAGALALAGYEAMNMEDAVWWLNYHARRKSSEKNDAEFRKILEEAMKDTGLPLKDVAEAATDEVRMFQATPGIDQIGALPKLLRAAAFEAKAKKHTTMPEAMQSIVGMAHMVGAYTPEEIDKLLPNFAYLSIANPQSLKSMERAFSYSVPVLQAGADIDPFGTMTLGTALATSGVTNTKSGTWIREMVKRSMPGDDKHNAALKQLGLIDDNGKPTWFVNGKPDPMKLLEIAGPKAAAMPVEERIGAEHRVFGTQGSGAFSVLAGTKQLARMAELRKGMEGADFRNQYEMALEGYRGTTKQQARSALQEFNVAMIELGTKILPMATGALHGFTTALGWFGGGHQTKEDKTFVPTWAERLHDYMPWSGASRLPKPSDNAPRLQPQSYQAPSGSEMAPMPMNFLQGPKPALMTHTAFSFNVDGQVLAQTMIEKMEDLTEHARGAPAYNGLSHFGRADGGIAAA